MMRHLTVEERQGHQDGGKGDWSCLGTSSGCGWGTGIMAGSACRSGGGDDQSILSSEEVKVVLNAHALDCRCDADCKELG